jgi:ribonuclease HII
MARKKSQGITRPSSRFEDEAAAEGAFRIAGIDEAGRGPLAGPVVAAAVVLPSYDLIPDLNDSKLLTPGQRENLFRRIEANATAIGIALADVNEIDEINIYQATRSAMRQAVSQISPLPDYLLIDGNIKLDLDVPQRSIVKGDRLSFSVAAAGIMAKVTRDRIMLGLHEKFPEYGFDRHKGYATLEHRQAILRHGPSPVHRRLFKGVRDELGPLFSDPGQKSVP